MNKDLYFAWTAIAGGLLPPTGLAVLALVLLLARRWRGAAVALGLLVLLSMQVVTGGLLASLMPAGLGSAGLGAAGVPGAIVILSGDWSAEVDGNVERLRVGAALQRRAGLPILVAGGADAARMAASLRDDFGVMVRWVEPGPGSIAESSAVLRQAGISLVFLVVDEPEVRLAARVFREAGVAVTPAAVPRPDPLHFEADTFLPLAGTWVDSAQAIRQWAGLACDAAPWCAAGAIRPGPN